MSSELYIFYPGAGERLFHSSSPSMEGVFASVRALTFVFVTPLCASVRVPFASAITRSSRR